VPATSTAMIAATSKRAVFGAGSGGRVFQPPMLGTGITDGGPGRIDEAPPGDPAPVDGGGVLQPCPGAAIGGGPQPAGGGKAPGGTGCACAPGHPDA
jgi:hypothetical protein